MGHPWTPYACQVMRIMPPEQLLDATIEDQQRELRGQIAVVAPTWPRCKCCGVPKDIHTWELKGSQNRWMVSQLQCQDEVIKELEQLDRTGALRYLDGPTVAEDVTPNEDYREHTLWRADRMQLDRTAWPCDECYSMTIVVEQARRYCVTCGANVEDRYVRS